MLKTLVFILIVGVIVEWSCAEREKSECEQHRERESKSFAPLPMHLIPECESNGDYKPLQCFKNSKFCACWDKSGNPATQPSGKIKSCQCLLQKHEADKKGLLGAYKPQCEEDGKFKKRQCHGSTGSCWCTHPETGEKLTEPSRDASAECK
ncbi:u24-ctenitoxin-Pn1a [Trichonephila clavipes]|nr:u24-ctenitoxin-Pn1a [Trichonephila clavipes]